MGIKELVEGDLGITELLMVKIMDPVFASLKTNTLLAEFLANQPTPLEKTNPNAVPKQLTGNEAFEAARKKMLANAIPGSVYLQSGGEQTGLKALEKTLITSMMESHKPLMDMAKILLELLGVGEDVVCRFLGTSIKILGKQIGIPSRNPKYWSQDLGYAKTITYSKKEFDDATTAALGVFNKSMSDNNPIKKNVNDSDSSNPNGTDDKEALYVGYFDEDGNAVEPPKWVKDSNKWLSITDRYGKPIGAPFEQLTPEITTGSAQLRTRHSDAINNIKKQKQSMLEGISARSSDIETQYTTLINNINNTQISIEDKAAELKDLADKKSNDLKSLDDEKASAGKEFDDLIQTLNDVIDGTNIAGHNLVDDEDPSKGVNPPGVISEWIAKVRGSQLRQKYFPETISTAQTIVGDNGEGKPPYVYIPSFTTDYNGRSVQIEVPLAYNNQIQTTEEQSSNTFFDNKLRKPLKEGGYRYSIKNIVNNIDLYYNTDSNQPYRDNIATYFKHDISDYYIPDKVKNYYLPIEWEEIDEYEVRYVNDPSKVIRTETEIIPFKIDVETDYELRVIKVVNLPLLPPVGQSGVLEFFPNSNDLLIMRNSNQIQFLKVSENPIKETIKLLNVSAIQQKNATVSSGTSGTNGTAAIEQKLISSTKFITANRYIDEKYYIPNLYFYLRKENSKWGNEVTTKDSDDSEIFQVKSIDKQWLNNSIVLTTNPRLGTIGSPRVAETGTDFSQHIVISNTTKTIKMLTSKISTLPSYILQSPSNQFKILSGININREIRIIKIDTSSDYTILKYEGDLLDELFSTTAQYNSSGILTSFNTTSWNYSYAESSGVETFQAFTYTANFNATIYPILDINYVPDVLKNPPSSIVIQGMNDSSILSTITNEVGKVNVNPLQFTQPDLQVDGIFTISSIKTIKTDKGVSIKVLQVNEKIESKFLNRAYSGNPKDSFYFPLRIVGVPSTTDSGGVGTPNQSLTQTGTLYTYNNNIPQNLLQGDDGQSLPNNLHSTPDINENNLLKEGIIFQGLDPRYVHRTKYKVFWLVEAIKKDDRGIAPINKKFNPKETDAAQSDSNALKNDPNGGGGKLWYGLLDKFTALPILISKLVPIIASKLIPLIIKIIQLISNPGKIKDLLLSLITDKGVSKVPENFKAFDKDSGTLSKVAKYKNVDIPDNFDTKPIPDDPNYYAGPQVGIKNPSLVSMMDGKAVMDFGKSLSSSGKPMFTFGLDTKFAASPPYKPITSKKKQTDFTKPPEDKTQSTFQMIMSFIKMPFEIIFKIFKWIMDWVKKMLNPLKIPGAVAELVSFKWLIDIIGKKNLFQILGITDPSTKIMDDVINANGKNSQKLFNDLINSIAGGTPAYSEVLVYHIFRNGIFLKEEVDVVPYEGSINDPNLSGNTSDANRNNNLNTPLQSAANITKPTDKFDPLGLCGPRFFSPTDLLPIPFWSDMPKYNLCELPQIFLKPLELILGTLKLIQELLNSLISMPMSILGLDPQIPIPKFGKEIPFANVFEDKLNQIRSLLQPISAFA